MDDPGTAAGTLDLIREGATHVVGVALARLDEASDLIRQGRFDMALARAQEATGYIQSLASAQQYLGTYGRNVMLVRARDLEPGMNVPHVGVVERVDCEEHPSPLSPDACEIVTVHLHEADAVQFDGDKQLVIWVE